ncbi:hypothetical protein Cmtc_59690 [Cupriavidus sp. TKC]|jgi:hypothetical protein|uniref:hypothetical protein n=1 Tax=Cupriavidus TaxID=106589 RepID=UPI001649234B|nr:MULTISPECIES: hypothetical protein [Cupriavidus]MCA3192191.1 hypothetical protein [Cupriavidus sp.]MCA3233351.1 hypothetical protein [Cupriavidus sp.]GMG94749.1 hypothetical protein Cmtc_59690 [Cupriavidus sp. TKC]
MSSKIVNSARAVIGASGTIDGSEAPTFAVFDIDRAFIATVSRLINLCNEHKLTEARTVHYPAWGPGWIEEELKLQNGELVVQPNGIFRFTDYPKYGGYLIQTADVDFNQLRSKFDSAVDGEVLFLAKEPYVRQYYEQEYEQPARELVPS